VVCAFTYFSRQLAKGSRLRLVVHLPNSIYLEKNYNSGGVVQPIASAVPGLERYTLSASGTS